MATSTSDTSPSEATTPAVQAPANPATDSTADSATIADTTAEVNAQAPAVSQTPAVQSTSEVTSTPATDVQQGTTSGKSTTSAVPAASAQPVAALAVSAPASTENSAQSASVAAQPVPAVAPLALAVTTPSVSAVNPNSVDVTKLGYDTMTYASVVIDIDKVTNTMNTSVFYSDGEQVLRIAPSTTSAVAPNDVLTDIWANKLYIHNVTFSATNTRLIDGQTTLTSKSGVTMHIPAQTITMKDKNFNTPGITGPWFVWTADNAPSQWGWVQAIDLITGQDTTNNPVEVDLSKISVVTSTTTLVVSEGDYTANFDYG